jgi:16S rRNA (guanine527-N7)-methyltransferase
VKGLLGRPLSEAERRRFARYLDLLLEWNRTHRLTAAMAPREMVRKLFVDSLLFLPVLPPGRIRVVDIGTGAGIPGVPMRILEPRLSLTLIEARRKRVSFLAELKRALELDDLGILHGRAEAIRAERPELVGTFDVAVMRAAGALRALAPEALTYVKLSGLLVVSGPPPGHPLPAVPPGVDGEWRTVTYKHLALSRVFLVARKGS